MSAWTKLLENEFNISSFHWKKKKKKKSKKKTIYNSKNLVPKKLLIIYCFVNAIFEKVIKTELFSNHKTCRKKMKMQYINLCRRGFSLQETALWIYDSILHLLLLSRRKFQSQQQNFADSFLSQCPQLFKTPHLFLISPMCCSLPIILMTLSPPPPVNKQKYALTYGKSLSEFTSE